MVELIEILHKVIHLLDDLLIYISPALVFICFLVLYLDVIL